MAAENKPEVSEATAHRVASLLDRIGERLREKDARASEGGDYDDAA